MRTSTTRDIRLAREQVAYQFHQEAIRLHLVVEESLGNYRYRVYDNHTNKRYIAMVLPCSFDYYEFRLNVARKRKTKNSDMLIVEHHNAVVPVPVCSLSQVRIYEPLEAPALHRKDSKRRNHEESMLLLSKLILNFESAYDELSEMTLRSKQRYLAMRAEYLKPRIGRAMGS
jgi:hypothetical protein